jgi:hypothetical protein
MTDAAIEAPAEPVSPVMPAPDLAAEVEAARVEADATGKPGDARALPEIDPAAGALRRAIIDHLVDTAEAGSQSVAAILSAMPVGTSRNTLESALRRSFIAGEIERAGPGLYIIGKPKPAEPSKPAAPSEPDQVGTDGMTNPQWFDALEAWQADPSTWDVEKFGPPLDQPNHRIPRDVAMRFADRLRKREERAAKQAAADAELHRRLLSATCANHSPQLAAGGDVAPIRAAMELVPLDTILSAIRGRTDRRIFLNNEPAVSWSEPRLLKAIAEKYCKWHLVPGMIETWGKAGITPQKAVERAEPATATPEPATLEDAPAASPPQSKVVPGEGPGSEAAALLRRYGRPDVQADSEVANSPVVRSISAGA